MSATQPQYKARILRPVTGREPLSLLAAAPATLAADELVGATVSG